METPLAPRGFPAMLMNPWASSPPGRVAFRRMERPDEPKAYLVAHVREALASDGRTNELHVDVTVAGKRVFLSGEVASEAHREAVAEVVRDLVPDLEVHNETSVAPLDPPTEPEKLS